MSSHVPPCTKHVRKHSQTLSFSSGIATLLNAILLKKLILSAVHGRFLQFESQAHTHVNHLVTLLGDGKEIRRTVNTVLFTSCMFYFFHWKKENSNLKLFTYKMTVMENGPLKNLHAAQGD